MHIIGGMKKQPRGKIIKQLTIYLIFFMLMGVYFFLRNNQPGMIPVTGNGRSENASKNIAAQIKPSDLSHILLKDGLKLSITGQPRGKASFISPNPEEITHFSMTQKFGSFGFLAHNYLAGERFYQLRENDGLELILANGSSLRYRIVQVHEIQAVNPHSVKSDFIDLDSGETISAHELFLRMYGTPGNMTLQTCLERDGNQEWGRRFVIAVPAESA